ncbi:dapper homolog 3-like [Sapajus apella]|uniref:Dapper homolog 3-like n=1 Tax=Sapajus apella TaxID=9515 RepID=A0A6J3GQC8_SAPAP|nr:dapper homolog 3-like [Sapajus apella]
MMTESKSLKSNPRPTAFLQDLRLILRSGSPPTPPAFRSGSLRSAKGAGSWGSLAHQSSRSCRRGAPRPREPLRGFPSAARLCSLSPPPPPAARPRSPPPAPPAGARTPGLRHVGAREVAAAAAAAGARARAGARVLAGEIALHAAGAAAAFRSASGPRRALRAGEAAEGRRTRTGGGARRAGASWAVSTRDPQPGGSSPALSRALCSSRYWGLQAARCRCASSRRRPAETFRSRLARTGPCSAGKSLVYPEGRTLPPEPERAGSPKSASSASNFPVSPSPCRSLRQTWERCAPSRAARPLPTRHPWDRLLSAARLGVRSLRRVAQERSKTARRFADSASTGRLGGCWIAFIPRDLDETSILRDLEKALLEPV